MLGDEIAGQAVAELRSGRRALDSQAVEAFARWTLLQRTDHPGVEGIVRGVGFALILDAGMPAAAPGMHAAGLLIVRPQRDEARQNVIALHELPHALFRREGIRHHHADVWATALAIGCPLDVTRAHLDRPAAELAAACSVPWWFAWLRLEMLCEDTDLRVA